MRFAIGLSPDQLGELKCSPRPPRCSQGREREKEKGREGKEGENGKKKRREREKREGFAPL